MKVLSRILAAWALGATAVAASGIVKTRFARAGGVSGQSGNVDARRGGDEGRPVTYVFDAWTGELVSPACTDL